MRALGLEWQAAPKPALSTRTLAILVAATAALLVGGVLAYGGIASWLGASAGIDPAAFDCY